MKRYHVVDVLKRRRQNDGFRRCFLVITALLMAIAVTSCASAGGNRERGAAGTQDSEIEAATGPVAGEVVAIEEGAEAQILTVERADGSRVYVEVPQRLARTLRIQVGDRITSEEHEDVRPGERLRVQRLTIDRG